MYDTFESETLYSFTYSESLLFAEPDHFAWKDLGALQDGQRQETFYRSLDNGHTVNWNINLVTSVVLFGPILHDT